MISKITSCCLFLALWVLPSLIWADAEPEPLEIELLPLSEDDPLVSPSQGIEMSILPSSNSSSFPSSDTTTPSLDDVSIEGVDDDIAGIPIEGINVEGVSAGDEAESPMSVSEVTPSLLQQSSLFQEGLQELPVGITETQDDSFSDMSSLEMNEDTFPDESDMSSFSSPRDFSLEDIEMGDLEIEFEGDNQRAEAMVEDDGKMSIDYPDEEIGTILRHVASLYDLNLVIPGTLMGRTSVKLKDVAWRQVFKVILKPVGYTFKEEGDLSADEGKIIRVLDMDEVEKEPMKLRTFPIKYAKALDIAESLQPLIDEAGEGTIQVDLRSNSLIVKHRPAILDQLEDLLNNTGIDKPAAQVMIETKFIEITEKEGGDNDGTGFDFWTAAGILGGAAGLNVLTDGRLNFIGEVASTVTPDADSSSTAGIPVTPFPDDDGNPSTATHLKTAVFSARTFDLIFKALKTSSESELVANPTIVTLNNETAKFHVGQREPVVEIRFNDETGTFTTGEVTYIDVGVEVEVTPQVNSGADQITLDINPKVSRINEFRESLNQVSYPVETIRETKTRVSIKNGYTLALGGLLQDDVTKTLQKIPLLGDLPVIGRLFQLRSTTIDKKNLVVFITAKTLNPDGSTYHDILDPRQLYEMGIKSDDIPGYSNGICAPGTDKMTPENRVLLQRLQHSQELLQRDQAITTLKGELDKRKEMLADYQLEKSRKKPRRRRF